MPNIIRIFIFVFLEAGMIFYAANSYAQNEVAIQEVKKDIKADVTKIDKKVDAATKQADEASKAVDGVTKATADKQTKLSSQVATTVATMTTLQTLLDGQKKQLEAQQQQLQLQAEQIEKQNQLLLDLQKQLNAVAKTQADNVEPMQTQQEQIVSQSAVLAGLQTEIDRVKQTQDEQQDAPSKEEIALKERIASLENSVAAIPSDPSTIMGMESFPGSIRIPGSNAAIKFGGFVKASYVKNFDPLASTDRFIVGSIPVGDENSAIEKETSMTANQSRFNMDVREESSVGQFRAFIEGDFGGDNNTFRLRHAYGQYGNVLAGQTWSTFFDPQAAPEEADFEGISGKAVLRQAQLRWFPSIGKDWGLQVALEDPQAEVSDYCDQGNPAANGCGQFERAFAAGVSNTPDGVVSIRRNWAQRYHIKLAGLIREIRATSTYNPVNGEYNGPGVTDSTTGWGLTASGVIKADWWGKSDNIKFQITGGKGLGHYTNDTNTVGGLDGVFDANQTLYALPLVAGFAAYEHWWSSNMRSTLLLSFVNVDTYDFQPDNAYDSVKRATANYFWSPIRRVDIGAEVLWGRRENKDGQTGDASQIQVTTKYRF
ncbi:MAG: DcaP family trimeric outer membrane transporter [Gammaproteobacteria bacterium]|nr:DcaP family trimeric outer membrane transporter [Gammaproteobacteria bacterium]